jgi:hypothetical protein
VSIVGPAEARPADGLAVDFVVESDRAQLSEIVQRVRDGRLRTIIGNVSTLDDAAFNPTERRKGKRSSAFVREDAGCTAHTSCQSRRGRLASARKERTGCSAWLPMAMRFASCLRLRVSSHGLSKLWSGNW